MITPDYCLQMARYNRWQNRALIERVETAESGPPAAGGALMGLLSHLLWGDLLWFGRLDGGRRPDVGFEDGAALFPDWDDWRRERLAMDARILGWAGRLIPEDLGGEFYWHSRAAGRMVSRPMALCVMHVFNRQTHLRAQAMALAGGAPQDSRLIAMPDEADWM